MTGPEQVALTMKCEAWRVTEANLEDVARWCRGIVSPDERYVHFGQHLEGHGPRQAFVGDWVLRVSEGFFDLTDEQFQVMRREGTV